MKPTVLASLAVLASLVLASTASAQAPNYQPVRVDLTAYGAYASADANAYGFGAVIEPKYNVTDRLAVGFRLEGAGFITQTVDVGPAGSGQAAVSQGARAVTAYLLKADWYATTSAVRPFVGLGLGLYNISSGSQSVSGGSVTQQAAAFRGFGFCPQLGLNLGGFRLAATYHVITGGDQVVATQVVGAATPTEVKLSKNFFAFEIGGTIGGNPRAREAAPAAAGPVPPRSN
jgi:outer membrane protein W